MYFWKKNAYETSNPLLFIICFFSLSALAQNPSFKPMESFEAILARAKKEQKPIFFEVFLPNCSHCMAYDVTFKNPKIKQYLDKNVLAYQLDISKRENGLFLRKQKFTSLPHPVSSCLDPMENMGCSNNGR